MEGAECTALRAPFFAAVADSSGSDYEAYPPWVKLGAQGAGGSSRSLLQQLSYEQSLANKIVNKKTSQINDSSCILGNNDNSKRYRAVAVP